MDVDKGLLNEEFVIWSVLGNGEINVWTTTLGGAGGGGVNWSLYFCKDYTNFTKIKLAGWWHTWRHPGRAKMHHMQQKWYTSILLTIVWNTRETGNINVYHAEFYKDSHIPGYKLQM